MLKRVRTGMILLIALVSGLHAQERIDWQTVEKIREEGLNNSQVMKTLFYLTDVHGPRLTGSPGLKAASEWSRDKLQEWGLTGARLEPWGTFGRGWELDKLSVEMTAPVYMPVIAYAKAWSPGTGGIVEGKAVLFNVSSEDDFEAYRGTLKDAIVLVRPPSKPSINFEAEAKRHDEESLEELATLSLDEPNRGPDAARRERWKKYRERMRLLRKVNSFLIDEGARVILEPSMWKNGIVRLGGVSRTARKLDSPETVPQLVVASEHYNRMARLLENDVPVSLRIDVRSTFFTEDTLGYNVIAEIPGTDRKLKKQVVMLGAHIDSWHAGTGATDNAAGTAVMMEAVRILKAIGAKPKRTIRIALWSGEEQGLLGSRAYVKKHFGDRNTMQLTDEHKNFAGYFNLDNGGGRIRGIYLQKNFAVRPIFEAFLKPFHDLGAETISMDNTGGTDHLSFDAIGLPGFQFIQDPMEYFSRTHHSNLDTYDHVLESDLKQAATIIASFVWHTATRPEKLPRKPLPKPRETDAATH